MISERFMSKTMYAGDCVIWTASISSKGYGRFWNGIKAVRAHRWIYEKVNGKIPAGLEIDHICRNRICVNPAHLQTVTSHENTLRGLAAGIINGLKKTCRYGHPFTPENIKTCKNSKRRSLHNRCRECVKRYNAERWMRLKKAITRAHD